MKSELQILIRSFPIGQSLNNPWGDYDHIIAMSSRLGSETGAGHHYNLYFRANKNTGELVPLSEEAFKDECVQQAVANSTAFPVFQVK